MTKKRRKRLFHGIVALVVLFFFAVIVYPGRFKEKETETSTGAEATIAPSDAVVETAPTEEPVQENGDPTEKIASFLQGPRSWKARLDWSGKWGNTLYDGGSFGGFGCGLCCMANIYCSLTDYRCSPIDMYKYAKKMTEYGGGGAIDWPYMRDTLQYAGFTCEVGKKPKKYKDFQQIVKNSKACLVVVSSEDSTCYWKSTPGHYVVLFLYNEQTDEIFLTDSGDPNHNRHWVPLKKIYRSLKTANYRQYMTVTAYTEQNNQWKHNKIGGTCVLPAGWEK